MNFWFGMALLFCALVALNHWWTHLPEVARNFPGIKLPRPDDLRWRRGKRHYKFIFSNGLVIVSRTLGRGIDFSIKIKGVEIPGSCDKKRNYFDTVCKYVTERSAEQDLACAEAELKSFYDKEKGS
jgi:hypothetical protein